MGVLRDPLRRRFEFLIRRFYHACFFNSNFGGRKRQPFDTRLFSDKIRGQLGVKGQSYVKDKWKEKKKSDDRLKLRDYDSILTRLSI